jgi:hypothetical protein
MRSGCRWMGDCRVSGVVFCPHRAEGGKLMMRREADRSVASSLHVDGAASARRQVQFD